jgi:peptidoglycan/LPS O-acetylase OafA/YrhL
LFFGEFYRGKLLTRECRIKLRSLTISLDIPYNNAPMRHVPALDGLRAVAILSVMTFHAGLPLALGGSLGVDVFFVISGWLITTILIDEIERTGTMIISRSSAGDPIAFCRRLLPF